MAAAALGRDPAFGDLFVFEDRKGDRLKVPAWAGDGSTLYLRRLGRGTVTLAPPAVVLGGHDSA